MRKILLLFSFIAAFGIQQAWSQAACTPNSILVTLGIPGIYPNPIQSADLPDGMVNTPYSTTLTLIVLGDTTIDLSGIIGFPVPPVQATIEAQRINNISGLPAGVNYACEPNNCVVMGDSAGCIVIQGTPTAAGSFSLDVDTEIGVVVPQGTPVIGGQVIYLPIPGISYNLEIDSNSVGIAELRDDVFSVVQNGPNPFRDVTEIHFNSPKPTQVGFQVTDMTGKVHHQAQHRAAAGTNTIRFEANGLAPGIYFYTLSNGEQSVTHKMVIID